MNTTDTTYTVELTQIEVMTLAACIIGGLGGMPPEHIDRYMTLLDKVLVGQDPATQLHIKALANLYRLDPKKTSELIKNICTKGGPDENLN